jgi:hypothetical protein
MTLIIGKWCTVSSDKVDRLILFEDTINSERYGELILRPFSEWLTDEEPQYVLFQQDSSITLI